MRPTGDDIRVLQIHPSLRCNLRCLHCYSLSSPEEEGELAPDLLQQAIADAYSEGYNVLGVSGGEPLLYQPLLPVLQQARSLGMTTTVTTNGMLLSRRRLADLHEAVDLLAISLDGVAESHNRMRNAPRAFELMQQRLEDVRNTGLRFGFIFTLTLHNLHELATVARFAVEQGAILLQVHPLEEVGRAKERLVQSAPDRLELAYAFLEVARLQKLYADALHIQFDVVDLELVHTTPERVFAAEPADLNVAVNRPLADLVSPLIIENDGSIVPIQYGFSRSYALGRLTETSLRQHATRWKTGVYPSFLRLCRSVFDDMLAANRPELPFFNWYGLVTQASREAVAMPWG